MQQIQHELCYLPHCGKRPDHLTETRQVTERLSHAWIDLSSLWVYLFRGFSGLFAQIQSSLFQKRIFLPIPELYGLDYSFHFIIFNGLFYKLVENIDDETWELYVTKL